MKTNTECARERDTSAFVRMLRETIPVNVWDDYWDDDEGKPQETMAYVEDHAVPAEDKHEMLKVVHAHLLTLDLPGVKMGLSEDRINFEGLTHARRERLVDELQASGLKFNGKPFRFYSES